ncbi:MAG: V-type ATPase subunit [Spirochaetaceae bacterium]|nr:V-type ATPase subunit [Spirochaetaceae bacterium]
MLGQDKLKKYAFINAKLRARISKILDDNFFEQMIKAKSIHEAMRLLHNTPFSILEEVYSTTGDLKLAELELYKKEIGTYREIEKHLAEDTREAVVGLTRKYEIENLKAALRLWFDRVIRKRNIDSYTGYLYREKIHHDLNVDQIINVDSIDAIISILARTPYAKIIKENALQLETTKHLFPVEIALDRYFYEQLYEKAKKLDRMDSTIFNSILGIEVDVENISWLVRFRDFYKMSIEESLANMIPRGSHFNKRALEEIFATHDFTEILRVFVGKKYAALSSILVAQSSDSQSKLVLLNRLLDQIVFYEVKKLKTGYPFTIGIVLAYFILKKSEIQKIMTVLNAKYYNIEEERIKSVI